VRHTLMLDIEGDLEYLYPTRHVRVHRNR
jgi:hypothetical protein